MNDKLQITHPAEGLALLTIHGSGPKNAAGSGLAGELQQVCEDINFDSNIRAVVITGVARKAFCTGPSVKRGAGAFSLAAPVASLNCPVIAAINGEASGMGLELALACDIRLASSRAHFSLPYIEMGLIPSDGATQRLPRLIGRSKAIEMMLTGEEMTAGEALSVGLVNRVVAQKSCCPLRWRWGKRWLARLRWRSNTAKKRC